MYEDNDVVCISHRELKLITATAQQIVRLEEMIALHEKLIPRVTKEESDRMLFSNGMHRFRIHQHKVWLRDIGALDPKEVDHE